jgi:putative FmdB family regulatory protein
MLQRSLGRSIAVPLYEYRCPRCGTFEQVKKFSDPPLTACPTCGRPVEKLLSAPAIQFKGTGWYVTDYARKAKSDTKPKEGAASADAAASTASSSSETKGDGGKSGSGSSGSDTKK